MPPPHHWDQVCAQKQMGYIHLLPSVFRSPGEGYEQPRLAWGKCGPDKPLPKSLLMRLLSQALHDVVANNLFPPLLTPSLEP